jgi:hypothetical protein
VSTSLLSSLVDDAALFPPGNAPMAEAVPAHRGYRSGELSWFVGRFLCPASRVAELIDALEPGDDLEIGLIADTGLDGLADALDVLAPESRLLLGAVEIVLRGDPTAYRAAVSAEVPLFLELPRGGAGWLDAVPALARMERTGAKLRTGGLVASAFPTPAEVVDFLCACVVAGVPVKCTAGLHHAVSATDPATGFDHLGFGNVLLAVDALLTGSTTTEAIEVLAERSWSTIARGLSHLGESASRHVREAFVGYGSCSVSEPVEDLRAMGLFPTTG